MNDEILELFDELIHDMQRRIEFFEQRAMYARADVVRVDKRLVELKRLKLVRQLQERSELDELPAQAEGRP